MIIIFDFLLKNLINEPNIKPNRLMTFIWQLENFPNFSFSTEKLLPNIQNFALQLGEANVMLSSFSQENKQEVFTEIMLSEAPLSLASRLRSL